MEIEHKFKPEDVVPNTISEILDNLLDKLSGIEESGAMVIYFNDDYRESIDSNTPMDMYDALKLIEHLDINQEFIDSGVIDTSSIERHAVTLAYESIYNNVANDDFIIELERKLETEINYSDAQELIKTIEQKKESMAPTQYIERDNQIWIKTDNIQDLTEEDFPELAFPNGQVSFLSDNLIKVFASNKDVNRNAIVIENFKRNPCRIYLMQKDGDLDIREYFKWNPTIKEMDYNLDPKTYVNGQPKREFASKKEFIWYINQMADDLLKRESE